MSGGSYKLTGRQFLAIYAVLDWTSGKARKPSATALCGKMRNRIEKLLRMEEREGLRVFARLNPSFKPAYKDGRPLIGQDGEQAKYLEYDKVALKQVAGEFRFDPVERGVLFGLLNERIEAESTTGDEAAFCLRVAGWLGFAEEIEARVLTAHDLEAYAGKISPAESDEESIPEE